MDVRWTTAFLDNPSTPEGAAVERFWQQVTGSGLSSRRGPREEFATLVPPDGDAYLRVQRVAGSVPGAHLDLHVDDLTAGAADAVRAGASVTSEADDLVVLRSPGGFAFCLVHVAGHSVRPRPVRREDGLRSLVDQVSLDVPDDRFEREARFWQDLTGWPGAVRPRTEFLALERPPGLPLRLLLQRLASGDGPVTAHLDLAADDRDAEAARHETLGAVPVRRTEHWTTLRDPAGRAYCITRRSPDTGLLPET